MVIKYFFWLFFVWFQIAQESWHLLSLALLNHVADSLFSMSHGNSPINKCLTMRNISDYLHLTLAFSAQDKYIRNFLKTLIWMRSYLLFCLDSPCHKLGQYKVDNFFIAMLLLFPLYLYSITIGANVCFYFENNLLSTRYGSETINLQFFLNQF